MEILEIISVWLGYMVAGVSLLFVLFLGVAKVSHLFGVVPGKVEEGGFLGNFR